MTRIRKNPDFIAREIAGEMLLVPTARARAELDAVLVLEGIGPFVWRRLDDLTSEEDLIAAIIGEYQVGEAQAASDLSAFLTDLREAGAIVEGDAGATSQEA